MKRLLAALVGLALALVGTMAVAAWLSTGSANATATATSVNKANAPTASRVSSTVSLNWTASTLANGAPVSGYRVLRHHGSDAPVEVCITTSASCVDTQPLPGSVQYGVVATSGTQWTGPESDLTSFTFDNVAPVTTANVSPSPNGAGWNKTAVTATLNATDSSGVDHISYTVDGGSLVTVSGATASFPVSGAGNHTVTYYAVDGVGNVETTKTLPLKIDPSAPVTTVTPSPAANAAGWNNTSVTLGFSAVDVDSSGVKSVTVDGVTTNGPTASKTVTAEGTTTVSYFATDVADNVEGPKGTTVKIDKTKPTSSISPASSSSWIKQASQSVTITAADAAGVVGGNSGVASIVYTVDGGSAVTVTGTTASFSLGQGDHTITYHAVDVAGNAQLDQSAQIRVDNVLPTSTITPSSSTTVWRNSGAVTFNGTDATSGVASFIVTVDGGSAQTLTASAGSASLSPNLADGTHTVTYKAVDNAGNTEGTTNTATVKVDTGGPSITNVMNGRSPLTWSNDSSGSGSWTKDACAGNQLCATIADAGAGVDASTIEFQLTRSSDGKCFDTTSGGFITGPCSITVTFASGVGRAPVAQAQMANGTYTFTIKAKDNAGNLQTQSVTLTIT